MREAGGSRSAAVLRLRHSLDADCGGHRLALGCALWVYNQTGLPIALQMAGRSDEEVSADLLHKRHDDVKSAVYSASLFTLHSCPLCLRRAVRSVSSTISGVNAKDLV